MNGTELFLIKFNQIEQKLLRNLISWEENQLLVMLELSNQI